MNNQILITKENAERRRRELEVSEEMEKKLKQREKNSFYNSFLQVNRDKDIYKAEDKLMKESPFAYRVFRFLAQHMDNFNAILISNSTLQEIFDCSRTTVYRAIKKLEKDNFIQIYKSGTSNVYALNDNIVWSSWGKNKKYSKFSAKIVLSESEQDEKVIEKIKTKEISVKSKKTNKETDKHEN